MRASLPIIWDADFLYGPRTASGEDSYVLCEINVSSCFAIPDQAPAAIAKLVLEQCRNTPSQLSSLAIREGNPPKENWRCIGPRCLARHSRQLKECGTGGC